MKKIGLLSDTHGFINPRLFSFFEKVDEIWHAGDIGTMESADLLAGFKPLKAVYGNIDDHKIRSVYPEKQRFMLEQVDVLITHIGGYPGHYQRQIRSEIMATPPNLFICGHSHILKVIYDQKLNLLHINPGAAGNKGFHRVCTAVRFVIDGADIQDLEIWEMKRTEIVL